MAQRPKNKRSYHPKGWLTLARTCGYDYRKLARRCSVTVRTLQRWFRADHAMTPEQWLIDLRLKDVAVLLKKAESVRSVQEKLSISCSLTGWLRFNVNNLIGCFKDLNIPLLP